MSPEERQPVARLLPPGSAGLWLILFEMQGRQVAGWAVRKGAVCPEPRYPGRDALARLVTARNEVWESPYRPQPD